MSLGAARTLFFRSRSAGVVLTTAVMALTAPNPAMQTGAMVALDSALIRVANDDPALPIRLVTLGPALMAVTAPNPTIFYSAFDITTATAVLTAPDPSTQVADDAWANGFGYRRTLGIAAAAVPASAPIANFPLRVVETRQSFRTVANGGKLQSTSGYDHRFEAAGSDLKTAHEVEDWSAATGAIQYWANVPSLSNSANTLLHTYYGKAGLTSPEASASSLWGSYALVANCLTGADRTGQGRTLTPTGVASGTLFGTCGSFNGAAVLQLADVSFLADATSLTVQLYIQPDASMVGANHGFVNINTPTGSDGASALTIQYLATSSAGANVIHVKLKTAAGTALAFSTPNMHSSAAQLIHVVFQDAAAPKIYVNGVNVTSATGAVAQSGGLLLGSGGLFVGAGARDAATGGYVGLLDELRIKFTAISADQIATEAANYLTPDLFYALGGEDQAADVDLSVVAVPMRATAVVGIATDIDVAAAGYDPESGTKTIIGTPTATVGTVSIVSNKLRLTASTLPSTLSYILRDSSLKQSGGKALVTATAGTSPAYAWPYPLPGADAVTASMVKLWTPGTALPAGYVDGNILVVQAPATPITIENWIVGVEFKGHVVVPGADFQPAGIWQGSGHTESTPFLGLTALMRPKFSSTARSHVPWEVEPGLTVNWPVFMVVNSKINYQTNGCNFGDIIRGSVTGATKNNAAHELTGPKAVIIWNKVIIERGTHYASNILNHPSGTENGHSDGIQSLKGFVSYRAGDCQIDWTAGQLFFSGQEAGALGWPRTVRWKFKNVAVDHSAPWTTNATALNADLLIQPQFVKAYEESATANGENYDYAAGQYMATLFETTCYMRGRWPKTQWASGSSPSRGAGKYLSGPGGVTTGLDANQYYRFLTTVQPTHNFPAYAGELKYLEPAQTLPQTCDPAHVGSAHRVTSVAQFLAMIQP